MEQIGTQVRLPLGRALQIAIQGIRIRFGRSLVTVSGVVLGIAFLMSNVTSQLIKGAIAREREVRQTVSLMATLVRSEVGDPAGRRIGVVVAGSPSDAERQLLADLLKPPAADLRIHGLAVPGATPIPREDVGRGAALLMVLGDAPAAPASLAELGAGLVQPVVLDSLASREYPGQPEPAIRRELFFGKEADEQMDRLRRQAEQARFRTIWIAAISILVTIIGVSNALLMSVTERFREIGTMKCLGALSAFIRRLFLLESAMIGLVGSVIGTAVGALIPVVAYGFMYRFPVVLAALSLGVLAAAAVACIAVGTLMAMLAAIYPANFAARMVPASALRSNV